MTYWITIFILRLLVPCFTRFRVHGRDRIPRTGAFLLVSNHISHFDPPVYSTASVRAIDWMGSEILFRGAITRLYFRVVQVIKVRQYEADQAALREAVRRVRAGRCVGLFPEGGIRAGAASFLGSQHKVYEGAFMIAVLARAPILPCLVIGSDRLYNPVNLLRRPPIWVRFGEPIVPGGQGREEIQRLKDETLKAIRRLADELRAEGVIREDDWPKTPQERNPRLPPPRRAAPALE